MWPYFLGKTSRNNMDMFSYSITVKSNKELSEKQEKDLKNYFSLRKKSNGGECEVIKLGSSLYSVTFKKKEVKERVLNQKDHCMESQGEVVHFTLQVEDTKDQTQMQSLEMPGNSTSVMESFIPSANTGLGETFVPLDSNFQYEVVKDKIYVVCQAYQSLTVRCENRELILSSKLDISHMRAARDEIKNIISSVTFRKIEVSKANADFLNSWNSKDISEKLFGDLPEGKVILDVPRGLCLYAPSENHLSQAESILLKHLRHGSMKIKANEKDIVSSQHWKQLWDKLMDDIHIQISLQDDDNTDDLILTIAGFTEDVNKALKECEHLLHHRQSVKEEVYLKDDCFKEKLEDLLKRFNLGPLSEQVQIIRAGGQTLTLMGPREEVEKSKRVLEKLMQKHVEKFCITKYGATSFFKNQGKNLIDDVQKKFDCCVFISGSANKNSKAEGEDKTKVMSQSIKDKDSSENEVKRYASCDKGVHKDGDSESSRKKGRSIEKTAAVLQLIVSLGNLENKKANAFVAPLPSTRPHLDSLNVTKGLKNKGGDKFSNLFSAVFGHQTTLQSGQHFPMPLTGESYLLDCNFVIFIACQPWDGPDGSSVKALKKGLCDTLNYCHTKKLHSVAMSVIGPGKKLCYPSEEAVGIIGEEVKSFVERQPNTSVKKIELVIPTENKSLYYVCREKLLEMILDDRIQLCNEDGVAFPKISIGEHSKVKIGNVSLVVTYNDITKESTDAIVNSTNFVYWNKNTVAHAIFTAAGQSIIRAAQHGSKNKVVMTEAGSGDLKCECKFDPEIVAHVMVDAIATLAKTGNMTSLTSVRLVAFRPFIYYILQAELKKLSRPVQESSWNPSELLTSRLKFQWFPENEAIADFPTLHHPLQPPTTQLVIVTDKKDKMNEIKRSLENGFENAVKYKSEKIEQPLLKTFSLDEIEMVFSVLNDQPEVEMILDRLNSCIIIEGCEKDVVDVMLKVQTNLATIIMERLQLVTIERAGLLVQWGYSDSKDSKPFTVEASQLLEERYQAGKKGAVIVKLEGQMEASVNLETMKAVIEPTKEKVNVVRLDLERETQCPFHWNNMNGLLLKVVELDTNSEEYERVKSNFNRTVNCPIKKIERIQNKHQHIAYMSRKRYITEKNGPCHVNEKHLFHGTAPQNCHSINYSGFNRNFAGHNAASFGNGVYFAVNASYSANRTYSPPDPNTGERFIYQVKVLVGRHTKGQYGMKAPPCRTENDPFDYYDSLTDKSNDPTMFVVFHDDQVYPEYLITFT
ncbi:protein mono-ADP-ribosyltransferase PARP14-like isoform X2 [Hyla sarda]|uniref:protein mono-ADP-ribosyltransferase PARP14-like isoform X2 n=1 Tax=Hyla sarda TaxID=327740 RepID=UPI0024C26F5B|nr:protein mono-ADP-ribosyltransferase PARP14-like isoform X2 [Hyla sarda]